MFAVYMIRRWLQPCSGAQSRLRSLIAASIAIFIAAAALTACGSNTSHSTNSQTTVQALWYSGSGDSAHEGTAEVIVAVGQNPEGQQFTLDLDSEKAQGAGPSWTAASWSAASVATLFSFRDPRTLDFSISIDGAIDGPSAGGLMATAMFATIAGYSLDSEMTMTGTINPDGSIGMVSGIPAKIRAAKAAGMKTVLIPKGARLSIDPKTGEDVDVIAEGKKLGIKVIEVSSLLESFAHFTGKADELTADAGPISPIAKPVLASIAKSAAVLDAITKRRLAEAKQVGVAGGTIRIANQARQIGADALKAGNVVEAYAQIWQTYLELNAIVAAQKIQAVAKAHGYDTARQQLLKQIDALEKLNANKLTSTAQTQAKNVQQSVGMPDVLTWSTDTATELKVYKERLTAEDEMQVPLKLVAEGVADAQVDIELSLDQSLQALMSSGSGSVNEQDASEALSAYTGFLKQTGDANVNYYEQVLARLENDDQKREHRSEQFGYAMAESLRSELNELSNSEEGSDGSSIESQRVQLAKAVSYYIASAQIVVNAEILDVEFSDSLGRSLDIAHRSGFSNAVKSSSYLNELLLNILMEEKLDSSYAHWGASWGSWQTSLEPGQDNDGARLQGLENTWLASIQLLLLNSRPLEALQPTLQTAEAESQSPEDSASNE